MPAPSFRLSALLGAVLLAATATLHAAGGFTATLPAERQADAGLLTLSPVECLILDQLVAGELATSRRADGQEPAGSFVGRRTEAERKAAGLDRLTEAQLTKLDESVASLFTARPKPKERPRLKESEVLAAAPRPQIHGSVNVAYGWGGGREMWAESLWLDYYDPGSRVGLSVGLSNFNGPGYYPDYYGYDGGRYYAAAPVSFDASYRGGGRQH